MCEADFSSLQHRANFVGVSPHLDASCIFSGFLFHCLGLSEHAFSTYAQWAKLFFFFFFFLLGLSLALAEVCEIEKMCW